jgi:predicted dehydrogenase
MDNICWGIIGCGDVTEVKSGPAFQKVEHSSLVAVMRRDAGKAADYARRHNVPRWCVDAAQLISDPDVNAVYVATPPCYHEEYAIAALAAGKPVYVEKPMATTAEAAERMRDASVQFGAKLCVAHYRRALPIYQQIKQLLDAGRIGTVRLVSLRCWQPHQSPITVQTADNWRVDPAVSGGGLQFDLATHPLDLMHYFFGPPRDACGLSANQAGLYAADDIVTGVMRLPNDVMFTGQWCFTVAPDAAEDVCEIIGSAGQIRFSLYSSQYTVWADGREETITVAPPKHIQQPLIEAVVRYFRGEGPNPCPADEAIPMLRVMETFTGRS